MKRLREKIQNWLLNLSEKSKNFWLAVIAFAESSFFPVPPDPFLMLAIFNKPKNWIRYTLNISIFSVLGGIFGYLIGFLFFDVVGQWLIDTYHLVGEFETVRELFAKNAFWAVFVSAFTPIPYKIFTIASGFFVVNIISFIVASLLGRTIRFFIVGAISHFLGKRFAQTFLKYFDIIAILVVILLVLYVFLKAVL